MKEFAKHTAPGGGSRFGRKMGALWAKAGPRLALGAVDLGVRKVENIFTFPLHFPKIY